MVGRPLALVLAWFVCFLVACSGGKSTFIALDAGGDASADGGAGDATTRDGGHLDGQALPDAHAPTDAGPSGDGATDGARGAYTIGGTVTGLIGTGLVLADNGSDLLTVSAAGPFTFQQPVGAGHAFNVTIKTQPTAPAQTCSVSGGQGSVAAGDVTSVVIHCDPATFTLGGTVTGLAGSVTLGDGLGDSLLVSSNGAFAFATPLATGTSYAVTVEQQPGAPVQSCVVTNGDGAVGTSDVTSVQVTCTTTTFPVGGTVSGLAAGATVVLTDNGGDMLSVTADGAFSFPTSVASGAGYSVAVASQPASPSQTCLVTGATGTVGASGVTSVQVTCTTNVYTVGGTLSGLASGDSAVLFDDGGDPLTLTANGPFTFPTSVASGQAYGVTVHTQPGAPSQRCTVTGGAGTVGAAAVTSVGVSCLTNAFSVGGTVTGLLGSVVLQDNGGDTLTVSASGTFAFATPVASGAAYSVTVLTQPAAPSQTCVVSNGAGVVGGDAVTSVALTCTTNVFTVSATVTGLSANENVVLADNGGDDLTVSANGTATFATAVASGQTYAVTVLTNPSSPITETCVVGGGAGTVGAANVTSVSVTCSPTLFTVSGTLVGLGANDAVVLQDNGKDPLSLTTNGAFTFPASLASGTTFNVTVLTPPSAPVSQSCVVTSGSGPVTNANVTGVTVTCTTNAFAVGGTVTGLSTGEHVTLLDEGGDALTVTANGVFAFPTSVASGQPYAATVSVEPSSPVSETCVVTGGSGTVGAAAVTSISVNCTANTYTVGGQVTGLSGTVILSNAGGAPLSVTANGAFAFPAVVASGQPYGVTVTTNPTSPIAQTCVVSNGSGTVAAGNVTTVSVACSTNTYTVGGTLTGLGAGDTVVLQDNAGDNRSLTANGAFTFATSVASGSTYAVTVLTNPSAPIAQTCLVTPATAQGTVGAANVTSVAVTCGAIKYTVGGTLAGLGAGATVTLTDNGGDALALGANGSFTFATPIASGSNYAVAVKTQPTTPAQTCAVANGSGKVGTAGVTSVIIVCSTSGPGEGSACTADSQCGAGFCSLLTNTCVAGQSCKAAQAYSTLGGEHAGIDSCGTGESTDATKSHESCCRSLLLPASADATPTRMDKYEVTTGRVRQFVEAINQLEGGYNLRQWAQTEVANGTPTGERLLEQMTPEVIGFLPTSNDPSTSLNLPAQLGATSMDANEPSEYQGCYMAVGAYGAGDYWQPASTLASFGSPARSFPQGDYDIKSMNCGTYWIYAAFCAWDGGRLPTIAEVQSVWGPGQYPWTTATGATAPFLPNPYPYTAVTTNGTTNYYANIPSPSVEYTVNWNNNSFADNPGDFYFYPNLGSLTQEPAEVDNGTDLTPYIASPGRFPLDVTSIKSTSFAGTEGWQDLGANMLEITLESSTTGTGKFCDCGTYTAAEQAALPACTCPSPGSNPATKPGVVRAIDLPNAPWSGGSWEGHESANPHSPPYFSAHSYNLPLQTQYGKAGFRCVRPAP